MNKRALILLTVLALLYCASGFAQDVIPVFNESQAKAQADAAAIPPDTPVGGIGDVLNKAYLDFMNTIATATSGVGSSLTASFRGLATTIVTLYIMFFASQLMRGNTEAPKQAVVTIVLIIVVTGIVFNPGSYQEWIAGPIIGTITSLADFLASKTTGGQTGGMFQALAGGMDKIMAVTVKMDQSTSIMAPLTLLLAAVTEVVLTGTYVAVIVVFMLINIITWFNIYITAVFGAICLYFAIYNSTRHIFYAWLRAMCNYGMVICVASLIMGICLKVMLPQLEILAAMDYGQVHPLLNAPTYTCIAINVLSWCMLLKAPDLAAALTGGSAGNTAGIAGVVSMSAGAAYGGARWMMMRGTGGLASGAAGSAGAPGGGRLGAMGRAAGRYVASARKGITNP